MANGFNKEEMVMFEAILEGCNDALVMSNAVSKYHIGDVNAERANDTIWRPQPYIMKSYDGLTRIDADFDGATQLSVPSSIGFKKNVPFQLTSTELRDASQRERLTKGAHQKLASDINVALTNIAAEQGTLTIPVAVAATGYDDIALCDAAMNELGIPMDGRYMALSSRDYNNMAGNLAARETMNDMPTKAWKKAYVGDVAGFETFKLDYANRAVASPGNTVTIGAANQNYTPSATVATTNGQNNVDNRYMTLTTAATTELADGDSFTIAGVNAVHHITKADTGQLKTFRVISGGGTNTLVISPPIIAIDASPTKADYQYQNVTATPANGAAIVPLNIAATAINPFWSMDSIELIPARLPLETSAGMGVMHATTDQGIDVVMSRQAAINSLATKYRLDVSFGTVMTQPEKCGQLLFNQT